MQPSHAPHSTPANERPTFPGDPAAPLPPEGTEPLPLPAPRDPAAEDVNADLEAVGRAITTLRMHRRRILVSMAAEELAAAVAPIPMTDVWAMTRIVAEALGEPAGEAFERSLLALLSAAREPRP
jgi:hypothetical protein